MIKVFKNHSNLLKLIRLLHIGAGLGSLALIYMYSVHSDVSFIDVINTRIGYNLYFQVAMLNFLCFIELSYKKDEIPSLALILLCTLSMNFTLNILTGFFHLLLLVKLKRERFLSLKEILVSVIKDKKILGLYILHLLLVSVIYLTLYSLIRG
ncbi:hypothetical protein EZV73_01185 [Acidaminobacter sp. JC074]|uniref:hypothetical protein n=1 Tax=Acidaminobacter sp. JC074 TaxID=2530199 RepID=UPI001F0ED402|nr:hypothetical protein [Acidaminobacter sp. JC074]MCH4886156.1 hypothetical protein [Acidaminobacter sp. JC074]